MSTKLKTILIGYDGSDCARRALELVASLATDETEIVVASVAEPFSFGIPDPSSVEEHQRLLDEGRHLLAAQGIETRSLEPLGDPAEALVSAAKRIGADLLVVGTHTRGRVGRLVLGSIATAVLHHAPCSVLVVP